MQRFRAWLEKSGLPYHSPHNFMHGHIQYAMAHAESFADYKAISMNVMLSSMKITDDFYSNLHDGEVQNRTGALGKENKTNKTNKILPYCKNFLSGRNIKIEARNKKTSLKK